LWSSRIWFVWRFAVGPERRRKCSACVVDYVFVSRNRSTTLYSKERAGTSVELRERERERAIECLCEGVGEEAHAIRSISIANEPSPTVDQHPPFAGLLRMVRERERREREGERERRKSRLLLNHFGQLNSIKKWRHRNQLKSIRVDSASSV
jgi:hypothetical protein